MLAVPRDVRSQLKLLPVYALLTVGAIVMLLPLLWMVSAAFKPLSEVLHVPPTWIPQKPTWENFSTVFEQMSFGRYFLNSTVEAALAVASVLATSSLSGYAFAKFDFPGRGVLFLLILATLMIPFQVRMIPLYVMMFDWRLVDTYPGLVMPSLVDAFGIFLMRQYIHSIPTELIDAARIDGASEPGIFLRIILPLCQPALSALTIFAFMWNWESFLWPLVITNSDRMFTLPIGLAMFSGRYLTRYDLQMAAACITTAPVLLVFFLLQQRFIEGITMTGMKG